MKHLGVCESLGNLSRSESVQTLLRLPGHPVRGLVRNCQHGLLISAWLCVFHKALGAGLWIVLIAAPDSSTNRLIQFSYLPVILFPFSSSFLTQDCLSMLWAPLCLPSNFHTLFNPSHRETQTQTIHDPWMTLGSLLAALLLPAVPSCIFMPLLIFSACAGAHRPVLFIQLLPYLFLFLADVSRHFPHAINNDYVAF